MSQQPFVLRASAQTRLDRMNEGKGGRTVMKNTKKWVFNISAGIFVFVLIILLSYGLVYFIMSKAPQENTARVLSTVKAVCDISHDSQSSELEIACGKAQDASHTEYLCKTTSDTSSDCWVEDHLHD